jgi:hypothetical protein
VAERNPWFEASQHASRPLRSQQPDPASGGQQPRPADPPSPWRVRPLGRNRWLLVREGEPIAELGVLSTGEWWVCPIGEGLPWAETYASRGAASRAVMIWWLHTHPFEDD